MTTKEQASGAGFTEDGVEFYPMTLLSFSKLTVWMQDEARKQVLAQAREEGLRGELLRAYIDTGMRQARELSAGNPEGTALISSYPGMLKILEISSRGKFSLKKLAEAQSEDPAEPSVEFIRLVDDLIDRIYALTKEPEPEKEEGAEGEAEVQPDPTKPVK